MPLPAAAIGFMSQGTQDLTGGIINGFWNLRGEHQQSDMSNLNAVHNLNAMTYQAQLNDLMAARSHEYQKELLGLQAKYNSPVFLAGEARKGGLNPSVLFGKGNFASAGSAPSVSTPSVGLGSPGIAPARPYFDFMPSSIAQIASALNQLASAKKQGVETRQLEIMLDKYALEADLKNNLLELNVQLVKVFGSQEKSSEILERYAHAYQLTTLGDKDAAEKALSDAKTETEREVKGLTSAKRKEAEVLAARADELVRAQIENYRSSSEKNRAESKSINELLPLQLQNVKADTLMKYAEKSNLSAQYLKTWEEYQQIKLTPEQRKLLEQKITEEMERDLHDNSSTWWNPVQAVAWLISPLARQVGIMLGGSATTSSGVSKVIKP